MFRAPIFEHIMRFKDMGNYLEEMLPQNKSFEEIDYEREEEERLISLKH